MFLQVGIAAHEIGHALGMWHTQSRHDRDQYIKLFTETIIPDWLDQFKKETRATNENYGIPYDYAEFSSSRNGKPTMVPRDTNYIETLGSPFISFYELLMMNIHYGCLDKCKSHPSAAKCYMGGFPHPRDCSRCVCSGGYGGKLCNERPAGCGKILTANSNYQKLEDVLGTRGRGEREDFDMCYYWIQAPQGRKIEVKFESFSEGVALDGCPYAGVEIKTQKDQRQTGYRVCAPEDAGLRLVSVSNIVPVITYNRIEATRTVLQYRMGTSTTYFL
ncbi:unnamed protein product [Strongylus vulgaris]|uniref:Metalloendopeptidase n=1 Tax=Strongylus vulgaris TaxID=40348 RepID=A0A3P7JFF2_STRVU|nr:unnamed protein product [Strongylus vulgaris]